MHTSYSGSVTALILQHVTGTLPFHQVDQTNLTKIIGKHGLELADPNYHLPGTIDLLLGADVYYDLLLSGRFKEAEGHTVLQNTNLGWIISGPVRVNDSKAVIISNLGIQELTQQLKTFWELEEIDKERKLTNEEVACEKHFKETYTRRKDGRFVVQLPFRSNISELGENRPAAKQRLLQIEKRLENLPECRGAYHAFMQEYIDLDHMELVKPSDMTRTNYYMPHHYVRKESSSTTKFRVVFDGTAKPNVGISLNDALMVGPVVQDGLLEIMMRFRLHKFVFTADIKKMYRQVMMHNDHCDYQRVIYRPSPIVPMKDYRLKTVTYGTASAPFQATRCLVELADLGKDTHPHASKLIKRDFYVDDFISGADTMEEACRAQDQLIDLLSTGGFDLCEWASNSDQLVMRLPKHLHSKDSVLRLAHSTIKTLGIYWQPKADRFVFKVTANPMTKVTKRSVLSEIARLFDPLGWLAPVVVRAKTMIQRLWLQGVEWDDELPADIKEEWRQYHSELPLIEDIQIPRHMVGETSEGKQQLHGFCDASETAYGAVVFIRSFGGEGPVVRLVCSKSRVAPLKRISLPRLELCGAVILARLINKVMLVLSIKVENSYAWTDSTVVLSWLRKPPHFWKTFVANRVTEIQDLLAPDHWRHVRSESNPADCLSRGQSPVQIMKNELWWSGPSWLLQDSAQWPSNTRLTSEMETDASLEKRTQRMCSNMTCLTTLELLNKCSSLSRLIRVTSYCLHFIHNCKLKKDEREGGVLTTRELGADRHFWIHRAQRENFGPEIQNCVNGEPLPSKSVLLSLTPFVDSQGILRVGGRLQNAHIAYDQKHPVILPRRHVLTGMIIQNAHITNLHAGPQLVQAILRRNYWIIGVKQAVRQIIHGCMRCFRHRIKTSQQLMGNLPQNRLEPTRAFVRCGIDYAGPFTLKLAKGRGNRTHKAYVCVFVCFTTKAIHIELVNDLTTQSFIAALRRFVSRRGRPTDIHTDCGTNFVGAERKLRGVVLSDIIIS